MMSGESRAHEAVRQENREQRSGEIKTGQNPVNSAASAKWQGTSYLCSSDSCSTSPIFWASCCRVFLYVVNCTCSSASS